MCFICAGMNAYPAAIVYLSKHMQYAGWWVINNLFPYFLYDPYSPF